MPVITQIKQQKNKNRVNIFLDGKFGFGIDLDNFVKLNLKIEQELTGEEVKKIVQKAEFQKVYEKLLRFASLRPRSEKEIKNWLYRKKVPNVLEKDLFDKLKRFSLVDDRQFSKWWIEQRMEFKAKSKKALNQELRLKGVKSEIIEEILEDSGVSDEKAALMLLTKKEKRWSHFSSQERPQKMLEFLARNGFSYEVAREALKSYNSEEDD